MPGASGVSDGKHGGGRKQTSTQWESHARNYRDRDRDKSRDDDKETETDVEKKQCEQDPCGTSLRKHLPSGQKQEQERTKHHTTYKLLFSFFLTDFPWGKKDKGSKTLQE